MTINEMKQSYKQSYTDNVELSIFNCGHEYCQPGHTWGPGVRDHYLIHLVVAGKGVYQVNGALHTLQEGDLFLAKPNQLITYAADETDPWEYYWVGFNGACANKLVQQTPFSDVHPVHHCKDPQTVREALYNIYLSRGPEPQCEALMTGYLYIFMAHLMKEAREAMPNVGSSSSQYVLAAIKYIQFNYSHDISIDDIAKAYHQFSPDASWNGSNYTNATTGVKADNTFLVYQDTYIMGDPGWFMHATEVEVPEKYFTVK